MPIVGGSILSHDHFQGGEYGFAMAKAPYETEISLKNFPDVHAGTVKWPMSIIRLQGNNIESLVGAADRVLSCWREYTDEKAFIYVFAKVLECAGVYKRTPEGQAAFKKFLECI